MDFSFKTALHSLIALFYPSLCVHCGQDLGHKRALFCSTCRDQIELIDTISRCRTCFAELHKGACERCIHRPTVVHRQMASCESIGPMHALKNGLAQGRREMISAAASLMAYQWLAQKMPLPHVLIPLPTSFWQKQRHGFDPHLLLAQEVGKILDVPILRTLRRQFDWQLFLTEGRFEDRYRVINKDVLCDQHLLLIGPLLDDLVFRKAGETLKAFFPARIDALAFTDR